MDSNRLFITATNYEGKKGKPKKGEVRKVRSEKSKVKVATASVFVNQ
jgi:hypothetical protein